MLRILSYNIHFGRKTDKVLDWLTKEDIDIICLQEFPENKLHLLDTLFPSYIYDFVSSFRWDKTYGQVTLYKKNKIRLISSKKFVISDSSFKKMLLGFGENRKALLSRFMYKNKSFTLMNVHLTPVAFNNRRIHELERIFEEVTHEPTLLLGDFNYSSLYPRRKLFSFMENHDFSHNTHGITTHTLLGIDQQMDYIFSRGMKLDQVKVGDKHYSDHKPIFAEADIVERS